MKSSLLANAGDAGSPPDYITALVFSAGGEICAFSLLKRKHLINNYRVENLLLATVGWKSSGPNVINCDEACGCRELGSRPAPVKTGGGRAITPSARVDGGLQSLPAAENGGNLKRRKKRGRVGGRRDAQHDLKLRTRERHMNGNMSVCEATRCHQCLHFSEISLPRWLGRSAEQKPCNVCCVRLAQVAKVTLIFKYLA